MNTHPLTDYRAKEALTQQDLANKAAPFTKTGRLSQGAIAHFENRRRQPKWDIALALERATDGAVTASEIMNAAADDCDCGGVAA